MVNVLPRPLALAGLLLTAASAAVLAAGPASAATSPAATSLTLKAAKAAVPAKKSDTFTATLNAGKSALKGQSVQLEEQAQGSKSFVKVGKPVTTNSKGQATFVVVPAGKKGQKDKFEVVYAGTKSYKASHSNVVTVSLS